MSSQGPNTAHDRAPRRPETTLITGGRPADEPGSPLNEPIVLASNFRSAEGGDPSGRACTPARVLDDARVDVAVSALRPDYRALLVAVDGLRPGPSDAASEALLRSAETSARDAVREGPVEKLPHVAAWREAYRMFGAKPQRTRNSLEALLRRAGDGLPRVNRLTDVYNAISVLHRIPLGGEDLSRYSGAPRLVRATGEETFDTVVGGEPVVEHPEAGEVVWRDDEGVTCRRWNWRQARRTALRDDTASALFILDALAPMDDDALHAAAADLISHLDLLGPAVRVASRLVASAGRPG